MPAPQRRIASAACEACRAAKYRCEPSDQPAVCTRCLIARRECVTRTAGRHRTLAKESSGAASSGAFTLDCTVQAQPEPDASFAALREVHDDSSIDFVMGRDIHNSSVPPNQSVEHHAAQGRQVPVSKLQAHPSFNLASAESLLAAFTPMLDHFPCVVLPSNATVPGLARTHPFILLGILAATSATRTLQGHNLYDAEFRKVVALKFIAGEERTLELLQGIIVYCAWYPFHLRPKNKQVPEYIRMADEIVSHLGLSRDNQIRNGNINTHSLGNVRAYLAYCYVVSSPFISQKRQKRYGDLPSCFTPWSMACCNLLEVHAETESDVKLSWLVRHVGLTDDASALVHGRGMDYEGIDTLKLRVYEHELSTPTCIHQAVGTQLHTMFLRMYVEGGTLFRTNFSTWSRLKPHSVLDAPRASDLSACVRTLGKFLDLILGLDQPVFDCFTVTDWARLILAIILGSRLSFPITVCPEFDASWARSQLQLHKFLTIMGTGGATATSKGSFDILSASRIVIQTVKDRYDQEVMRLSSESSQYQSRDWTCPMRTDVVVELLPVWDPSFPSSYSSEAEAPQRSHGAGEPIFHNLWATMTGGWSSLNSFSDVEDGDSASRSAH